MIVRFLSISNSPLVNVIGLTTPGAKVIVVPAQALAITLRNEPDPLSLLFVTNAPLPHALFVRLKVAGEGSAGVTLAVTLYIPVVKLAVKAGAVATPLLSVVTVAAVPPPANVPLAPVDGAVNVTPTPLNPPEGSVTVAFKAVTKVLPTLMLCPLPAVAVISVGEPVTLKALEVAPVSPLLAAESV